ncbi:hypothetical protein TcasGA2_TC004908 [Tribolium castaneum]|uniref:Uncharacterized protein n=1 Tax=Tribolium castaneum TaxID=7070 RepID=D6WCJ6_TRICA|nr:hypothetical protein TcasGA2_TC004908 [Tribolium castaneum]
MNCGVFVPLMYSVTKARQQLVIKNRKTEERCRQKWEYNPIAFYHAESRLWRISFLETTVSVRTSNSPLFVSNCFRSRRFALCAGNGEKIIDKFSNLPEGFGEKAVQQTALSLSLKKNYTRLVINHGSP